MTEEEKIMHMTSNNAKVFMEKVFELAEKEDLHPSVFLLAIARINQNNIMNYGVESVEMADKIAMNEIKEIMEKQNAIIKPDGKKP